MYSPLYIAPPSFIQLSELRQLGVNEIVRASKWPCVDSTERPTFSPLYYSAPWFWVPGISLGPGSVTSKLEKYGTQWWAHGQLGQRGRGCGPSDIPRRRGCFGGSTDPPKMMIITLMMTKQLTMKIMLMINVIIQYNS